MINYLNVLGYLRQISQSHSRRWYKDSPQTHKTKTMNKKETYDSIDKTRAKVYLTVMECNYSYNYINCSKHLSGHIIINANERKTTTNKQNHR